jgi:ABC-type multidrug transport system ATPase subunit
MVAKWNVHWTLKFGFVMVGSLAVLFAAYHLLVRWTFIGQVLNGRRVPLRRRRDAIAPVAAIPADASNVAELRHVSKRFGKHVALDGADFSLRRGELLALLGPNGAGKSTAIALWLGLTEADAGAVTLAGGSPLDVASRRHIGVMMQDVTLAHGMRVRELIAQTSSYYPDARSVEETMKLAGIRALADKIYDKLSGGQKRQVQFALAICGRPSVLFLDEPSVGLDLESRSAMWQTLRGLLAEGCSILLTTHYLEEAEALADRVVVLSQGHVIAAGKVDEIRSLVSRREIRCASSVPAETLRTWPGVVSVSTEGNDVRLTVIDAETILRRLLAADAGLARLEVRQAGLAEAFTHLTREAA